MMSGARRRILVQIRPYERIRDQFTEADRCGASVVRHDIVEQFLEHGVVDQVFMLTFDGGGPTSRLPEGLSHVGEHGLRRGTLADLTELAEHDDLIFLDAFAVMPRASRLRHLLRLTSPVIGLLHSLPNPTSTGFFHWLQAELRPQDCIVASSPAGHRALSTLFAHTARHSAIPAPELALIPYPIDLREFAAAPDAGCRESWGWPPERIVLLTVGRFSEASKSDLEPLLWAISGEELRDRVHLVCAGADLEGYAARLRQCAAAYGIADRLAIVTDFPLDRKRALYAAADVFVAISDNVQETYGLSVIEAMASSLPVVAAAWSGHRDLVEHGVTGLHVETTWSPSVAAAVDVAWTLGLPDSVACQRLARATAIDRETLRRSLARLVRDGELRRRFGAAGRARAAARYGRPPIAAQFDALLARKLRQAEQASPETVPTLTDVFEPYASGSFPDPMRLRLTRSHPDDQDPTWLPQQTWPGDDLRVSIDGLLANLDDTAELVLADAQRDPRAAAAVSWLVKKGLCAVEAPAAPQAASSAGVNRR